MVIWNFLIEFNVFIFIIIFIFLIGFIYLGFYDLNKKYFY